MAPVGRIVAQDQPGEQPPNTTKDQQTGQGGAKFTPGPWYVERLAVMSPEGCVAVVNLARASGADAHLIAAAPDLYEALRDLRDAVTDLYKAGRFEAEPFVRAGLALAKAEGR